jgi:hypothetical protein
MFIKCISSCNPSVSLSTRLSNLPLHPLPLLLLLLLLLLVLLQSGSLAGLVRRLLLLEAVHDINSSSSSSAISALLKPTMRVAWQQQQHLNHFQLTNI